MVTEYQGDGVDSVQLLNAQFSIATNIFRLKTPKRWLSLVCFLPIGQTNLGFEFSPNDPEYMVMECHLLQLKKCDAMIEAQGMNRN